MCTSSGHFRSYGCQLLSNYLLTTFRKFVITSNTVAFFRRDVDSVFPGTVMRIVFVFSMECVFISIIWLTITLISLNKLLIIIVTELIITIFYLLLSSSVLLIKTWISNSEVIIMKRLKFRFSYFILYYTFLKIVFFHLWRLWGLQSRNYPLLQVFLPVQFCEKAL